MSKAVDYIVVGQGLAGTLMTYFLKKAGQNVVVIDNHHQSAASMVAAGIINPITGRRYVKSWMIDDLLPFSAKIYQQLEQTLNISFYHPTAILRTLFNHRELHDWEVRTLDESYQKYMSDDVSLEGYERWTHAAYAYGEVTHSAQVDLKTLITTYRKTLQDNLTLISESFDYQQIVFENQSVTYKGISAKKIIFCEGQQAQRNPYFQYLPFNPAKGEVLLVKIPNADFSKILKQRIFIVPLQNDLYWIGSTNDWEYTDDAPTKSGKQFLSDRLQDVLTVPFEIVAHQAAIRPTVKDRRPFLGLHPTYPQLAIFNGLGTKGASLAPYFAQHFSDFLLKNEVLMKNVNIKRFDQKGES